MNTILLLLLVYGIGAPLGARCIPPPDRACIEVSNPGNDRDTLWFGFDRAGSYGIDPPLCEFDLPPVPPVNVLEARFVNIPGRERLDAPEGLGLGAYQDYRGLAPGTCDTFRLQFQPGPSGYPIRLRWSPSSSFFRHRDSVILRDEFGGTFLRVRMDEDSVATITRLALTSMLIFAYSPLAPDIERPDSTKPEGSLMRDNDRDRFNKEKRMGSGEK